MQECPRADLAIVSLIVHAVRELVEERWSNGAAQRALATEPLHTVLRSCIVDGEHAAVADPDLLVVLGLPRAPVAAGDVWLRLAERAGNQDALWIVRAGTLSTRITRAVGSAPNREKLRAVYEDLAACLDRNELFGVTSP